MALVDYSDSESGLDSHTKPRIWPRIPSTKEEELASSRKRKSEAFARPSESHGPASPPLPSAFYSLYATNVRTSTSDDPALHGGRKRHVPHVEGNWPSHVYLEWYPSRAELAVLETVVRNVQAEVAVRDTSSPSSKVYSLLQSDLGVQSPLHISLSASLMLRTEQHAIFLEKLEDAIGASGIGPFHVDVARLEWAPNSDWTRWFLVLSLNKPVNDGLNTLLATTNYVARDLGFETLYVDLDDCKEGLPKKKLHVDLLHTATKVPDNREPREVSKIVPANCTSKFHLSIAWQLEEPSKASVKEFATPQPVDHLTIPCDCLKVKIGNVIHDIPLRGRGQSEQGLSTI